MTSKDLHPKYNVSLHQLTSPRAMQAYLVVIFSTTIVVMAVVGRPVPDIITYGLSAILGFYFKDAGSEIVPTVFPTNGAATVDRTSRVLEAEMAMDSFAYDRLFASETAGRPTVSNGDDSGEDDDNGAPLN